MSEALHSIHVSKKMASEYRCPSAHPLRIGIDAGPLLGEGGVSRYVRPLVRALLDEDTYSHYQLILRKSWVSESTISDLATWAPVHPIRIPDRILSQWWESTNRQFPIGRKLWNELDLFLATCFVVPILGKGRVISIVYDLIPLRLPHLFPNHREFKSQIEQVIARSQSIISISHRTKQDLIELFDVDSDLIHVIYPGCEHRVPEGDDTLRHEVAQRYGIDGAYALYVGSTGPHKNVETLLHAYEEACLKGKLRLSLVMVVRSGWSESCLKIRKTLRCKNNLICLEDVPAHDLPALYAGAQFMVWPSHYEGFGLPVLESMACGTPVILGKYGASPEVAGDDGYYVDTENPSVVADAIYRMSEDHALRSQLGEGSRKRALQFSWGTSARKLQQLLYAYA